MSEGFTLKLSKTGITSPTIFSGRLTLRSPRHTSETSDRRPKLTDIAVLFVCKLPVNRQRPSEHTAGTKVAFLTVCLEACKATTGIDSAVTMVRIDGA